MEAGSFVTLDCGGNPDAWREAILQVEDLGPEGEHEFMTVGKLRGILGKVAERVTLDPDARLTFEIGPPERPMQVFEVDALLSALTGPSCVSLPAQPFAGRGIVQFSPPMRDVVDGQRSSLVAASAVAEILTFTLIRIVVLCRLA